MKKIFLAFATALVTFILGSITSYAEPSGNGINAAPAPAAEQNALPDETASDDGHTGTITIYTKPIDGIDSMTILLRDERPRWFELELSPEGKTTFTLPFGTYYLMNELEGVEFSEETKLVEDIPLTFFFYKEDSKESEAVINEENRNPEIGSLEDPLIIHFRYEENAATSGILEEEFISGYLLNEDARLQYIPTPEEQASRAEEFPTLSEEYQESMAAYIKELSEKKGIEIPDDSKINAYGGYGDDPYGIKAADKERLSKNEAYLQREKEEALKESPSREAKVETEESVKAEDETLPAESEAEESTTAPVTPVSFLIGLAAVVIIILLSLFMFLFIRSRRK